MTKTNLLKRAGWALVLLSAVVAYTAEAQTSATSNPSAEDLQRQIQQLLGEMQGLRQQVTTLKSELGARTPSTSATSTTAIPDSTTTLPPTTPTPDEEEEVGPAAIIIPVLNRTLSRGSRGEDVRSLQAYLAEDPAIYPEGLASGYYGPATVAAVRRWQRKYGLAVSGQVNAQTLAKFRQLRQEAEALPGREGIEEPTITGTTRSGGEICPALPSVTSCPAGQERAVSYQSSQCGTYYSCVNKTESTTQTQTQTTGGNVSTTQTAEHPDKSFYLTSAFESCMVRQSYGYLVPQIKDWARASEPMPWQRLASAIQASVSVCEREYNSNQTIGSSNWARHTWVFRDGTSEISYIMNRFDREYQDYIAGIEAQCRTINRSQFAWKPNAGSDAASNWQSFGIPNCSGMAMTTTTATSTTTPTTTQTLNTATTTTTTTGTVSTTNITSSTATPPAGQKEQIWNSLGLKSWIRTDADSSRIEQLKQACVNVPYSSNIWATNAGTYTSPDFGLPDANKCRLATACTSGQYFNGTSCVVTAYSGYAGDASSCPGFAYSRWDSQSRRYCQLNNERRCDYNYPSYLTNGVNYTAANCPANDATYYGYSATSDYPAVPTGVTAAIAANGTDVEVRWTDNSNNETYFKIWRLASGLWAYLTQVSPPGSTAGASTGTTMTYTDTTAPSGYLAYMIKACHATGCSPDSNQTSVTKTTSSTTGGTGTTSGTSGCSALGSDWTTYGNYCLNGSRTQYVPLTSPSWSSVQSCAGPDAPVAGCTTPGGGTSYTTSTCSQYGSGWHVMGDNNCYNSGMTEYRTANGTLYSCSTTPSSGCSSSSSTASGSCGSGYYWNGSSCVANTYSSNPATACSQAGGAWNSSTNYCQMPTSGGTSSSCPSGQYWSGTACVISTTSSSCSSGQYWNGSSCVTSTTSSSCSSPGNCYDSAVCASSGWHWYNGACWSSSQTNTNSSAAATSCAQAGGTWNSSSNYCQMPTSSTSCSSGQYWNGTMCVTSTTTTSPCSSNQYWNGTSCVSSTCSTGQYWNGTSCVASPTSLSNRRYTAQVLSQAETTLDLLKKILEGLRK